MSQSRELRQKLEEAQAELRRTREHLEKLRAYQARERDSLQHELDATRSQVAGLRSRLQELEARGKTPPPAATLAEPSPMVGEHSAEVGTALVALVRPPSSLEQALPALSRLLKLAPADVRLRLMTPAPAVVARLPLPEAEELRAALRAEGFLAVSCPVDSREAVRPVTVKRFALEEQALGVEGTRGESLQVRYTELRLLVRGRTRVAQWETESEIELPEDGLVRRYFGQRKARITHEQLELFLWVFGKGARLAFTQATHFTGLEHLRAVSVFENLQRLASELQRCSPQTVLDERFMQTPGFSLPLVEEGRGQELLAEVMDQAIQEGLWP